MAALTASAWTEVVEAQFIEGKHRRNRVALTLSVTTGAFYPSSGGIPLPTTMGMKRNVDYVMIIQPPLSGVSAAPVANYMWTYDKQHHSIHGYQTTPTTQAGVTSFPELPTTWKPSLGFAAAPVMYVEAVGW